MERQLGLLVRLIDDLLDAARISRGKLTLRHGPTSLAAIIESAIETVGPMIRAGEHALDVQLPGEDIPLFADRERLSQVFSNLLSNAAKYSDAGTPISMRVEPDEEAIRIAVTDRGLGLSPEQKNLIFELFSQVDTSVERARGGLGIGLSLAQRIVEMHGGQVQVESEGIGHGSRFTVQLPRKPLALAPGTPVPAKPAPPPREASPARCRALVVDDNRDAADTLAMMLELMGHETRCIYDSRATLDTVRAFAPDVVFLDIGMPGMSGYDVARTLRATDTGSRPILVAVTGWGQADDRRRTAETGFDHHLVKPVDIATVQEICGALQVPVKSPA
jgi:CheY-like chemotaxis protein/anti-sigma regulatory factor (Ser/Thr protein kinase)